MHRLDIILTTRCYNACYWCILDCRPGRYKEFYLSENAKRIIGSEEIYSIGISGGEAFLYSKFDELAELLKTKEQLHAITAGMNPNAEKEAVELYYSNLKKFLELPGQKNLTISCSDGIKPLERLENLLEAIQDYDNLEVMFRVVSRDKRRYGDAKRIIERYYGKQMIREFEITANGRTKEIYKKSNDICFTSNIESLRGALINLLANPEGKFLLCSSVDQFINPITFGDMHSDSLDQIIEKKGELIERLMAFQKSNGFSCSNCRKFKSLLENEVFKYVF